MIAAWLAGATRPATAIRRWLAPAFQERLGVVVAVVALLFLLLILWGPTPATQQWWGILLVAALIALGVWALRRETLREFPDAGAATRVARPPRRLEQAARRLQRAAAPSRPLPPAPPA